MDRYKHCYAEVMEVSVVQYIKDEDAGWNIAHYLFHLFLCFSLARGRDSTAA